ncbi:MAG: heavy-metal-associated domain-containing protein [Leptolyngbya sp. SIO4C1]|nr:heavy-metal-associated domain-containing protein [Leptolyngbya sp. SIO4C1]
MKVQLTVPNMACGACARTITSAITAVDPKATVKADPQTKRVEAETEASKADLQQAIQGAGYAVS